MKRMLTLFLVAGLMAYGATAAKAVNLLANPDLDHTAISTQIAATPVSWTAASSKSATGVFNDGESSEGFANVQQPVGDCGGSGCGLFFKPFQGNLANPNAVPPVAANLVSASLSQDVAGMAGAKYSLTGWAGAEANYVGLSDPTVKSQFVLQFLDGANAVLGSSTLDLNTVGLGTSGLPNPFGYNTYTVSGTAPAGTVTVRSIAQMLNAYNNPLGGGQAFVVDSFDLEKSVVPEPASILLGLVAAAGVFGLARRRS
jgi:hypothetical protein